MTPRKKANDRTLDVFDDGKIDVSQLRRIEVSRGQPKSSLAVRFDASDLERLRVRAEAEGVGVTQLVRQWVIDRLDEPAEDGNVEDLVQALNESLRAARALKRSRGRQAG